MASEVKRNERVERLIGQGWSDLDRIIKWSERRRRNELRSRLGQLIWGFDILGHIRNNSRVGYSLPSEMYFSFILSKHVESSWSSTPLRVAWVRRISSLRLVCLSM